MKRVIGRQPRTPRRLVRATVLACIAIIVGVGLATVANAVWSVAVDGRGSASTATGAALLVTAGVPSATLYPGGQSDVVLVISNPNRFVVRIGSLMLDTNQGVAGFGVDVAHAGCATSALSFTTQTNGGAGWVVPANDGAVDGTLPVTLANAVGMDIDAANACQGGAFAVFLTAIS